MRIVMWGGTNGEPGAVQHGCMFTSILDEDYDTVYVYTTEDEARKDVEHWQKRGARAKYVTRVVPEWTDA